MEVNKLKEYFRLFIDAINEYQFLVNQLGDEPKEITELNDLPINWSDPFVLEILTTEDMTKNNCKELFFERFYELFAVAGSGQKEPK